MRKCLPIFILLICKFCDSCAQYSESSAHFSIEKLSPGVYAAIAKDGGYAICNAGIVDLGDATLVFDPFISPVAARDLKSAAEKLTGHAVKYVINSHFHNDHIGGNQVFEDAIIISNQRTRELIENNIPAEFETYKSVAPERLKMFKSMDVSKMSAFEKHEHVLMMAYFSSMAEAAESIRLRVPDSTFQDTLTIEGSSRSVRLTSYSNGHTESDVVMEIPDANIAFTGDLLFINFHPWISDGNLDSWASNVQDLEKENYKVLVPGHGPLGSGKDLGVLLNYFREIRSVSESFVQSKENPEEKTILPKAPFDQWHLLNFYKDNVLFDLRYLNGMAAQKR